jgi:spermidine synthase
MSATGDLGRRAALGLVFLLFFVSGFAALLYQVIWQRMLAFFSGADVYSVTLIVAAFMGGLGWGSLAGGHLADRLSIRGQIRAFALSEAVIGLFAWMSKWFYYDLLYVQLSHLGRSPLTEALVLFTSLLCPTFFMGMSLPLLSKALTRSIDTAASTIGGLYGVNTLGAAAGAFFTVWVLARSFSFELNLRMGALLNLACAVGALALALYLSRGRAPSPERASPGAEGASATPPARFSFATWTVLYALSGFIALSLEIVWFRLLGVMAKGSSFTFGNLLAIYLGGLAAGTLLGTPAAGRSQRPERVFLGLQASITIYAGLTLAYLLSRIDDASPLRRLWVYFGEYDPLGMELALSGLAGHLAGGEVPPPVQEVTLRFLLLYFALPLALIGPPTLMMGLSFPFLQRAVQRDAARIGRRVGWLQTANIVGSMLGALGVGWVALRFAGTAGTFKLLVLAGGVFLFLWSRARWELPTRRRRLRDVAVAGVVGVLAGATPAATTLWSKLHGTAARNIVFAEDETGLSLIKSAGGVRSTVHVNGAGESWLPYGGIHSWLGFLPAALHPAPRKIAIIGLGSGDTLFSAGGREETESLVCIEIIRPQLATLTRQQTRRHYEGLASVLEDERVRHVVTDGRALLRQSSQKYDVIQADASRPHSAYAGNLYSYEYFLLLRSRLEPGGFAVSWAPTERVVRTFVKAFPHVRVFEIAPLLVAVGSESPIAFDREAIRARLERPFTRRYYLKAGFDVDSFWAKLSELEPRSFSPAFEREALVDINTDLFPRDEFLTRKPPGETPR